MCRKFLTATVRPLGLTTWIALLAVGCATVPDGFREQHAEQFQADLDQRTAEALDGRMPLTLDDCIAMALENNLALRATAIDRELARLDKDIAFGNFLPSVMLNASVTTWDRQPSTQMFGALATPMHDQTLRDMSIDFQMPVVVPATWFLYSIRRHQAQMSEWTWDYARQMLALRVTAGYYECLALRDAERAFEAQAAQAQTIEGEMREWQAEGLLAPWQLTQAQANTLARQAQARAAQREGVRARADLLVLMGLSPLAELTLAEQTPLPDTDKAMEDLVFQALTQHPELHIADRQVAVAQDNVKIAIAEFVPKLFGFASFTGTSESRTTYPEAWLGGVSGILSLFNGFQNINQYRAAVQQEDQAGLLREEKCLIIMAQVVAAYQNVGSAREALAAAQRSLDAATQRLNEVNEQAREGMVMPSERLQAEADRDAAQTRLLNARYSQQLAVAVLRNTLGETYSGSEGN